MEDKFSFTSHQVIIKIYARISASIVFSGDISSPLTEENSSLLDNIESHLKLSDTSIDEIMSIGDFTE